MSREQWSWTQLPTNQPFSPGQINDLKIEMNRRMKRLEHALEYFGSLGYGVRTAGDGNTTPSVSGVRILLTDNSGATSITYFSNGEAGQTLIVEAGDAHTTVVNGSTLQLLSGSNWTPASGDRKQFFTVDGVTWKEV